MDFFLFLLFTLLQISPYPPSSTSSPPLPLFPLPVTTQYFLMVEYLPFVCTTTWIAFWKRGISWHTSWHWILGRINLLHWWILVGSCLWGWQRKAFLLWCIAELPEEVARLIMLSIWNLATSRVEQTYWLDICYRIFRKALSIYSGLRRKLNIWWAWFGFFSGVICQDVSCELPPHYPPHSTTPHFPFLAWFLKAFKHSFLNKLIFKKLFWSDLQKSCGCFWETLLKGMQYAPYPGFWDLHPIKVTWALER